MERHRRYATKVQSGRSKRTTLRVAACRVIESMRNPLWIGMGVAGACLCANAQWNHPVAGAPRTPARTINMNGTVPRVDRKPDLSGIWQVAPAPRGPGLV